MKKKDSTAILIAAIVAFICTVTVSTILVIKSIESRRENTEEVATDSSEVATDSENADLEAEYVGETHYIGGIGYPEVYQIPFKESELYQSNKDQYNSGQGGPDGKNFKMAINAATEFMNLHLNYNYMDDEEFAEKLASCYNEGWIFYHAADGHEVHAKEYAEERRKLLSDNHVVCEGKFITDESLVYYDGFKIVRGIAEFTLYDIDENGEFGDIPKKTKTANVVNVYLKRDLSDPKGTYYVIGMRVLANYNFNNKVPQYEEEVIDYSFGLN